MSITVHIPLQLRSQVGNHAQLVGVGANVQEILTSISTQYPGFAAKLYRDSAGTKINQFINIHLNCELINYLDGLATTVKDGDEVVLELAISGG